MSWLEIIGCLNPQCNVCFPSIYDFKFFAVICYWLFKSPMFGFAVQSVMAAPRDICSHKSNTELMRKKSFGSSWFCLRISNSQEVWYIRVGLVITGKRLLESIVSRYVLVSSCSAKFKMLTLKSETICISQFLCLLSDRKFCIILSWVEMAKAKFAKGAVFGR